jgi:protein O-GlcNAc transferase
VDAASAAGSQELLLTWLDGAADADPLDPVLPAVRGVLLERLGRRPEAIDALAAAAALAPDAQRPAALLAEVLARSNRLHEAEAALRRASELDPNNLILRDALAVVLMRMTRHADARSEMLASIERDGEQVNALCNLANATTCLGLQDEGVELARRAIDLAPNMRGRDVSCAIRCHIAMASPAQSCLRLSRIARTGCRGRACPRSPTRVIPIVLSWSVSCRAHSRRIPSVG